ncbi:ATP-dependent DNA helicase RecG [Ligilactobacillus sp. WC1T17]|uniref:ATP-dependent DNA helicase RecG n=1 Tax=Ligilactobacillus ruminis TaxID=1623 RepID=A0ABY1ABM1_9LACO|nr:ATP-dependent DNA helicase RecG [Ligilactobacillus ruminis]
MKSLQDSLSLLKGIGAKTQSALNHLGLFTVADLLTYYPFRFDDLASKPLAQIADGQKAVIKGIVATDPVLVRFGRSKNRLNFKLLVEHDVLGVTFFGQAYLQNKINKGAQIAVYGKFDAVRQSLTGMKLFSGTKLQEQGMAGIYRASKEIKANTIQKLVKEALREYGDLIEDIVPEETRAKFKLLPRQAMIQMMHFPQNLAEYQTAKRSAIFDEFFCYEAKLTLLKKVNKHDQGLVLKYNNEKVKDFIKTLPFELTAAQKRVVNEICHDLHQPVHMNRLLQGDVGSGKTVVAAIVMYAAITAGYQAALMAPTEILAAQHYQKLKALLAPMQVKVGLLTGSQTAKDKQKSLADLAQGKIDLVVGTHALIQDGVAFSNLGLAVIDEQHRFGVGQRKALRAKGANPDILAMTATPIPRTLAITTYGEMDVSIINELPLGRKQVKTLWVKPHEVTQALEFIGYQLKQGSQAYVISPLIEESEAVDLQNAVAVYEKLQQYYPTAVRVGLLHGRMKNDEKDAVMQDFKAQKYDILVSTTVIEVGVDVPNASVMLILDADRFGLAQLHQLRGRVGRGEKQSYCILSADPKADYGKERMQTMVETNDGFVIAQKDLELRGPGEVLGDKQSGMPAFKVGDPVENFNILQAACLEARAIILAPNFFEQPQNAGLIKFLRAEVVEKDELD